jgi:hypothetical protein
MIVAEIKGCQRWKLREHSCEYLRPFVFQIITAEIEVNQRSALRQHSRKPPWSII